MAITTHGGTTDAADKPQAQGSFAAPARSAATCEWHMSAEHKCGEPAEWEMLDEEWRNNCRYAPRTPTTLEVMASK